MIRCRTSRINFPEWWIRPPRCLYWPTSRTRASANRLECTERAGAVSRKASARTARDWAPKGTITISVLPRERFGTSPRDKNWSRRAPVAVFVTSGRSLARSAVIIKARSSIQVASKTGSRETGPSSGGSSSTLPTADVSAHLSPPAPPAGRGGHTQRGS